MNSSPDKYIYINIYLPNKGFTPAGVISFNDERGYGGFSYFPAYIEQDLPPLNPATLNYRTQNSRHFVVDKSNQHLLDRTFWEMLPQQNDWGNQVLISRYPHYSYMNNAQKLYFLGKRTVGGLQSYVSDRDEEISVDSLEWLDKIRDESIEFFQKNIEKITQVKAVTPLSSYGGLRPKCMFEDEEGNHWIAKFNLPSDLYNMARAEHVSLNMAQDMGLNVAQSKVITLPSGQDVFLSKRFDRQGTTRLHSISFFALAPGAQMVKKDAFIPGNPAGFVQTLTRLYSDFENIDSANIVTKFLLDIAVNNTDNHLRNLRLLLNKNNKWELSPIYDVTFNPYKQPHVYNPANVKVSELFLENQDLPQHMASELGVSKFTVESKLYRVKEVAQRWEEYCDRAKVSDEDKVKIGNAVSLGLNKKELEHKITVKVDNSLKLKPKS